MKTHEWKVGDRVAVYGTYDRHPYRVATIDKVYKTGHLIVGGNRYRPTDDGTAYSTGSTYSRGMIELLTPEHEHIIAVRNLHDGVERLSQLLRCVDPDKVPASVVAGIAAAVKEMTDAVKNIP